jgi:hypothetical protein
MNRATSSFQTRMSLTVGTPEFECVNNFPWFRFYGYRLNDPNVQRLSGNLFKAWINFMCVASNNPVRGALPGIADVAYRLRITPARADDLLRELVAAQLFEWRDGVAYACKWEDEQYDSDSSTARVQKFRLKRAPPVSSTVTGNVSETLHETNKSRTEQSRTEEGIRKHLATEVAKTKRTKSPKYTPEFEEFWRGSTQRGSKLEAFSEWTKLMPDSDLRRDIAAGMEAWRQSEQWQDPEFQPHVRRWLKGRGWEAVVPEKRSKSRDYSIPEMLPHDVLHVCTVCPEGRHDWTCEDPASCPRSQEAPCREFFRRQAAGEFRQAKGASA